MNRIQLSDLTLDQKIGQLFIGGFHDIVPDEQVTILIEQYAMGGVIYFRRNIGTPQQIQELSASLQQIAIRQGLPPLLISIDQEGGMVSRIDREELSLIPGNMSLGAADDPKLTGQVAAISARELRTLGINLNLAPCIDVNNNPRNPVIGVRSYSEKPGKVAEHGAAAIMAMQAEQVAATAKHFPGHGDTDVDSHYGLASVPHGRNRLENVELLPFQRAIDVGVDLIMSAHVIFPAFETEQIPATLSAAVLTGLLREKMGFQGLIITDCLEMHAIAKHFPIPEAAVRSLQAGADLLLVSHTMSDQVAAIQAVRTAVDEGRLTEARIDESVQRILSLKARREMNRLISEQDDHTFRLHTTESENVLREAALRSITVVKDNGQLPLPTEQQGLVIWPQVTRETEVDEPAGHYASLSEALRSYHVMTDEMIIDAEVEDSQIAQVMQRAQTADFILMATYTSAGELPAGQARLTAALAALPDTPLIVISVRNPYDINHLPEVDTYICCYENRKYAIEALAAVLTGNQTPTGKLPVSLNPYYLAEI
ncbi:glycoside hydrolase family 3 protein [Paenibacillus bovis]|uniref:Glycoside hydrolase n=1 Tax=Paenibacillus bovis TaxID=1616788 RepID=A0A172ZIS9_9BACL|nr:glycoside hydrolase family 3 N-terminal domain-containing protein [Paenibacillus bovis]ANF97545.1 glycoside hydrolase [Paenibacillus bovis]